MFAGIPEHRKTLKSPGYIPVHELGSIHFWIW